MEIPRGGYAKSTLFIKSVGILLSHKWQASNQG